MTRRTLASMLLLALLLVQGAAALCGVRCLLPAGAQPMDAASCHGMAMPDQGDAAHVAAPCARHVCPVDALDAVLVEDRSVLAHSWVEVSPLIATAWPDGVHLALPLPESAADRSPKTSPPPIAFHPLTDSLRV